MSYRVPGRAGRKNSIEAVANLAKAATIPTYGTFANRPTTPGVGAVYFATDQGAHGKPVWWNGTSWVDAASNIVGS